VLGNEGENNWFVGDVTVNLMMSDNLSGISFTECFDQGDTWTKYVEHCINKGSDSFIAISQRRYCRYIEKIIEQIIQQLIIYLEFSLWKQ
jgi:hypothetical protein